MESRIEIKIALFSVQEDMNLVLNALFKLYTGNFLPAPPGSLPGKGGVSYAQHGALCLEAQRFPDEPGRGAQWAAALEGVGGAMLRPGTQYRHNVVYKMGN